jgi:hypothetical protein
VSTRLDPLVDLLRTAVAHGGEVTFRFMPPDHEHAEHAETGAVVAHENTIYLAPDRLPDDGEGSSGPSSRWWRRTRTRGSTRRSSGSPSTPHTAP